MSETPSPTRQTRGDAGTQSHGSAIGLIAGPPKRGTDPRSTGSRATGGRTMAEPRVAPPHAARALAALCGALMVMLALVPVAAAEPPAWAPDELLIGYQADVTDDEADKTHGPHGAATIEKIHGLNVHRVRVPAHALENIEQALANRAGVAFVERNRRLPVSFIANDTYYSIAWHLPKISAPAAWDITQGSSTVVIAVLD